uniref:Uncharacterized protein n=1 Tax=Manihot esculenta TaxID=3983 RepID=A0A2C9UGX2_MANES
MIMILIWWIEKAKWIKFTIYPILGLFLFCLSQTQTLNYFTPQICFVVIIISIRLNALMSDF